MKSVNEVKRFYREAVLRTKASQDEAVLADALRAGGLTRRQPALRAQPGIWRTIMKSRTTKLVTAAGIVAAILISVSHVNETVVKAVEFEEITQAMQHVPWMHAVTAGFQPLANGPAEQWVGFEAKISANKSADGTARFMSEKDHQQFDYDPRSKTITARYLESLRIDMGSPAALIAAIHKVAEQQGAQMDVKMGAYQGRKAQIQSFTLSSPQGLGVKQSATLYIDPEAKLLYGGEVKAIDAAGKVVTAGTITFDYPSSGPQSIYDLGVPRDARIEGNGSGTDVQSFLNRYERARAEATREYIAVMALREEPSRTGDDGVSIVDVDYKSGRQRRVESHTVFHGTETAQVRAQYRQQLGDSFESLLAWTRRHYDNSDTYLSVMFYDGQYYASVQRDGDGPWGKLEKSYSPGGFDTNLTLSRQAWPPIDPVARIVEDDYARQNGWVCLEILKQGLVSSTSWMPLPVRFLYYLDPSHDYLCRRQVMEQRRDASWQKDKSWLAGVDPQKVPEDSTTITDIPEVTQAPNGHWYPQTIIQSTSSLSRDKRPIKETIIKKVYLQVAPKFPDRIFDIDRLPGQ